VHGVGKLSNLLVDSGSLTSLHSISSVERKQEADCSDSFEKFGIHLIKNLYYNKP
jgi:hypothetical protein|tara:strand:- start:85 stop:249 length:165 start_codon:yes stop_codon:yes gene_type:complete